jgi:hypothetical protein
MAMGGFGEGSGLQWVRRLPPTRARTHSGDVPRLRAEGQAMSQSAHPIALDLFAWRDTRGHEIAEACANKAERETGFDTEAAREAVLAYLEKNGPTSGEALTEHVKSLGNRPHDDRAFGTVYAWLAHPKRRLIVAVGDCSRKRGHGSKGGTVWALGTQRLTDGGT